ncbi:MAG: CDP-alcohol phosphatidyltransferase family protein [Peptococcaceae bacterium]|nr:CDP-alcohol phosphatidyltransferase family protein [Peptococcaceae bacterium]
MRAAKNPHTHKTPSISDNPPSKKLILIGHYNLANYLTLLGLLFSLASCCFALMGTLKTAVVCLMIAGICDLFDGFVARKITRTDAAKAFGVQLDTVADVVSFGMTPIIIAFATVSAAWYALIIYGFYILCAVIRLAYYNTTAPDPANPDPSNPDHPIPEPPPPPNPRPASHYRGLPVTYIALILPVVLLFAAEWASLSALAAVGVLYVLNIGIPKPKGVWYAIFPALAVLLILIWCLR